MTLDMALMMPSSHPRPQGVELPTQAEGV